MIGPAMDAGMYDHVATQTNVNLLKQRGALFLGPEEGHLASGLVGLGRMSEPAKVISAIRWVFGRNGILQGKKVVVSAGPTRETLDPVRFLSNHSTGLQGYAVAQAALDAGADVTLIRSRPPDCPLRPPPPLCDHRGGNDGRCAVESRDA